MFILLLIITVILVKPDKTSSMLYLSKNQEFYKVKDISEVPPRILDEIHRRDNEGYLNSNVWCFTHNSSYDTDVSYIMFSGGEKYKDGYDVDILSSKDTYIKDLIIVKEPGKRYKGYVHYIFEIAEESRPSPFKYSEGLSHAIVIFKAKHAISIEGEFVDYAVNQHGKKLYSQIGKVR